MIKRDAIFSEQCLVNFCDKFDFMNLGEMNLPEEIRIEFLFEISCEELFRKIKLRLFIVRMLLLRCISFCRASSLGVIFSMLTGEF